MLSDLRARTLCRSQHQHRCWHLWSYVMRPVNDNSVFLPFFIACHSSMPAAMFTSKCFSCLQHCSRYCVVAACMKVWCASLRDILQSEFLFRVILEFLFHRKLCLKTYRVYSSSRTFENYCQSVAIFVTYGPVNSECYNLRTDPQRLLWITYRSTEIFTTHIPIRSYYYMHWSAANREWATGSRYR